MSAFYGFSTGPTRIYFFKLRDLIDLAKLFSVFWLHGSAAELVLVAPWGLGSFSHSSGASDEDKLLQGRLTLEGCMEMAA